MVNSSVISTKYWDDRKDNIYLYAARKICEKFSRPDSVIDVGSNGTPTLEWHRSHASRLVSIDLRNPYRAKGVESITQNFFDYPAAQSFDLVTCFQVLEHVPEPRDFAQKLLQLGKVLVVSVPYQWPKGKCIYHIHDPVNEEKMLAWFQRTPDFSYIARELNKVERLIQVYKNISD
ncbi:methyltransferase domain-containing protein [uncultured Lamprocystis sp.]|jgi:2-polyprenyl-3-methyl-5-hydroxy-6-metoxy-1,4-benzoquinol methylase|uniref:class I SAM-dependent methyltransferase n=1 Tax=uncultured Lamprocystis sp. TaxID=543132 RepID=UPI0025EA43C5|nr:methyltransferase domain-containing protein [uncultured Lamprocystis sp.]